MRRSVIPANRSVTDLGSETAQEEKKSAAIIGLIADDGQGYVEHDSNDEEPAEQTIDEYIALLQQQRLEELGGDEDDVANNVLNQVLCDGSLGEDDDDNDEKDSKKGSGTLGGMFGSVFGRKTIVTAEEEEDDDDDVVDTIETNVSMD